MIVMKVSFLLSLFMSFSHTVVPMRVMRFLRMSASTSPSPRTIVNIDSSNSKLATKFANMVDRFILYTDEDIQYLDNERLQLLVLGGKDALTEPRVLNTFAILYEDMLPVRFGGDILFNLLDKSILHARTKRAEFLRNVGDPSSEVATAALSSSPAGSKYESTGIAMSPLKKKIISKMLTISKNEFEDEQHCVATYLFPQLDANNDGHVYEDEFRSWVDNVIITDQDTNDIMLKMEVQGVYKDIDTDADGRLTLEEFQLWTKGALENDVNCDVDFGEKQVQQYDQKTQEIYDKYMHMVGTFAKFEEKWNAKQLEYDSASRMDKIVLGCFAGSRNAGVVKALEILYMDYLPLRVAGDLIFKVVKKVML